MHECVSLNVLQAAAVLRNSKTDADVPVLPINELTECSSAEQLLSGLHIHHFIESHRRNSSHQGFQVVNFVLYDGAEPLDV